MQDTATETDTSLIDALMVMYLYREWKQASARVSAAYDGFSSAGPPDRPAAFAAYTAALDREEAAARSYASWAEWAAGARSDRKRRTRRSPLAWRVHAN